MANGTLEQPYRSTTSLQVGSLGSAPSTKLALTNAAADALLVYDSKPSVVRLYNARSIMTKASAISAKQITALATTDLDDLGDLVTASAAGIQTWRDAFDSRCTGPLRQVRHIRTPSLTTCLCTIRTRLIAGSASGRIAVYALQQKQPRLGQYDGHGGRRLHELIALGGGAGTTTAAVASAASDGTVRIWDVERFAQTAMITKAARSVAYWPRSRIVACGDDDGRLSLWTSDGSAAVKAIDAAHAAPIVSCRFPGRTPPYYLASLDREGILKIWDCRRFAVVQSMLTPVSDGKIASLGDRLIAIGASTTAPVYTPSCDSDRDWRPSTLPSPPIGAALFCVESDRIVLGLGRRLVVWSVLQGQLVSRSPDLCASNITAAALLTPSSAFVGDDLGFVYLIDIDHGRLLHRLPGQHHHAAVRALRVVLDRDLLYSMSLGRLSLCVLEHALGRDGVRRQRFALSMPIAAFSAAIVADRMRAVMVSAGGHGAVLDGAERRADFALPQGHAIVAAEIVADLDVLVSVDAIGVVGVWSLGGQTAPPRFATESLSNGKLVKAAAIAYSATIATAFVAVTGTIDAVQLAPPYRRLGRIALRTAPVRQLTAVVQHDQVVVAALSQHVIEFYSTEGAFLGALSSAGAASWRLWAPIVAKPRTRLRLAIAPSFRSTPPGVELPPIDLPNAIKCTKLECPEGQRRRRPPALRPSASEPFLKRTSPDLNQLLTISKTTSMFGVRNLADCLDQPEPVVNNKRTVRIRIDLPDLGF